MSNFAGVSKEIFDIIKSKTTSEEVKVKELTRMLEKSENRAYRNGVKDGQKRSSK